MLIFSLAVKKLKATKNRTNKPDGKLGEVPQLSWLERYTDNVEVGSSSLPGTTNNVFQENG